MFASPLRCCGPIKNINGVLTGTNNVEHIGRIVLNIGRVRFASDKGSKESCGKDLPQTAGRKVEEWPKKEPVTQSPWRTECSRDPQPPNYDPYRIKVPEVVVPPLPPANAKAALDCTKVKSPCSVHKAPDPAPCPPPPRPPFNWTYIAVTSAFLAIMGALYKLILLKQSWDTGADNKPVWRPRRKVKRPYHNADLPPCVQYLIVGTGAAGWAAYRAIMENDKSAKVFFVTKEDILPYKRPPMSKHMWWSDAPPDIMKLNYIMDERRYTMFYSNCPKFMNAVDFYRKKVGPAVSIASGWCVLRVDADDHVVWIKTMCGEQPMYYERLLLAPGSKPRNLNVFKSAPKKVRDRVTTLRTIRDLETAFRKVREAKHVTVLGGGLLGTELIWHLGKMNEVVERPEDVPPIEFVHVYKDRGILSGIIPSYLGEWAAEKIRCSGVTSMANTQVYDAFLTKDDRLQLTLSNGSSLVTDYVLVAVGADPRVELAEPSFLELDPVNGGFLVNTEMKARTHLYIAGDAASVYSQWHDKRLRMEHYINAEEQGYIAGANMTGHWIPSNEEPHYFLALGRVLNMEVVGEVGACMPTIALFKPCEEEYKSQPKEPPAPLPANDPKKKGAGDEPVPCFKKTEEYKERYKRGMLFYLRDETVVGMVFWNVPPIEDRKEVATELIRARPSYKDINLLAELLGFHETDCSDKLPGEVVDIGPCIQNWKYPPNEYCCS